ncbi:helix-turn-helix domain-containing protein [Paenibacillus sp. FSL R10-2736]|uniref:helix-turn-helix domain-containing protein n=1 Tax=Paenibacillus sp. FSL R10-2736 TaxID=2954692 RepID=UPI0030FAEA03
MVQKARIDQQEALDFAKAIGDKIRELRVEKGFTQEKLAELAGLHSNYTGQLERGEKRLSVYTLKRVAQGFGMSLEELFRVIDPMEREDEIGEIVNLLKERSKADQRMALKLVKTVLDWRNGTEER